MLIDVSHHMIICDVAILYSTPPLYFTTFRFTYLKEFLKILKSGGLEGKGSSSGNGQVILVVMMVELAG